MWIKRSSNGTSYHLLLVEHPYGGRLVVWPDVGWQGLSVEPGRWHWQRGTRISKIDQAAILALIAPYAACFLAPMSGDADADMLSLMIHGVEQRTAATSTTSTKG